MRTCVCVYVCVCVCVCVFVYALEVAECYVCVSDCVHTLKGLYVGGV